MSNWFKNLFKSECSCCHSEENNTCCGHKEGKSCCHSEEKKEETPKVEEKVQ